jgi:carbonic anhydrase
VEQLQKLRTYPSVERAMAERQLRLYGWFFDLKRAKVTVYDEHAQRFVDAGESAPSLELPARATA